MSTKYKSKKYFEYIWILFLLLLILDIAGTGLYVSSSLKETSTQLSIATQEALKSYLDENISLLRSLSRDKRLADDEISLEDKKEVLKPYQQGSNYFLLAVTDMDGNYFSTFENKKGSIADREYFKDVIENKKYVVTNIVMNRLTNGKSIIICMPIMEGDEVKGTIFGSIYFQDINTIINQNNTEELNYCALLDQNNFIMAHPNSQYVDKGLNFFALKENFINITKSEIQSKMNQKHTLSYLSVADKGFYMTKFTNIAETNWTLVTRINILTTYATLLNNIIIKFLVLVVLFLFIYKWNSKSLFAHLSKLAYLDELTQIGNINFFYLEAKEILNKFPEESYSIIRFDISSFKSINDTYGYDFGDRLLIAIANGLKNTYNDNETYARVTSDHFVILVKKDEYVKEKTSAWQKEFTEIISLNKLNNKIFFTAGIYDIKDKKESIRSMIDKANVAQKSIKNISGTTFAYYNKKLEDKRYLECELEKNMRDALLDGEFHVYFQPKFDLQSKKIVGAEALVRWYTKKGILSPDDFIPLFEKNGFIADMDFYILNLVARKIRKLLDEGVETVPISVNQSRVYMTDPMYIFKLYDIVQRYNIPPGAMELEVTESIFLDNMNMVEIIEKIKKIGFQVSMDDFGSGYSSLNLLREIEVDTIKIDKKFLGETTTSTRSGIIIKKVVEMAKELSMQIVCEGVETIAQADFLESISCDMAQGYLYSKPLPEEEFFRLLLHQTQLKEDV